MNTTLILFTLLELLGKSAVVILAALLLAQLSRRRSAALRHLIWLSAFIVLLALPATRLVAPRWSLPGSAVTAPPPIAAPASSLVVMSESTATKAAPAVVALPKSTDYPRLALIAWLTGVAAVLGYRLLGSWQLARLQRQSVPCEDAPLLALAEEVRRELGLQNACALRLSHAAAAPCTWGLVRPTVLLPAAALEWAEAHQRAALRHEFAHVARRDALTRWIALLAVAAYWPNPLTWLAARRLRLTQEQACDDLVLTAGTPPADYADLLVQAARACLVGAPPTAALTMARPSTLEGRVLAIVSDETNRHPVRAGSWLAAVAASCAVAFTSALAQVTTAESPAKAAPTTDTKPDAERVRILRRLAQDLSGTKLTFEELDALLKTRDPAGYQKIVDQLVQKVAENQKKAAGADATRQTMEAELVRLRESLADLQKRVETAAQEAERLRQEALQRAQARTGEIRTNPEKPEKPAAENSARQKAETIILPHVGLREMTFAEALNLIRKDAIAHDPAGTGVTIRVDAAPPADARISLDLTNIPLIEALKYLANLAGLELRIEPQVIAIVPSTSVKTAFPPIPGLQAAPAPDEIPVQIDAKSTRFEGGLAIAEGNAQLTRLKVSAKADVITYDPATKHAKLSGQVVIENERNITEGTEGEIWFGEKEIVRMRGTQKTTIKVLPESPH